MCFWWLRSTVFHQSWSILQFPAVEIAPAVRYYFTFALIPCLFFLAGTMSIQSSTSREQAGEIVQPGDRLGAVIEELSRLGNEVDRCNS